MERIIALSILVIALIHSSESNQNYNQRQGKSHVELARKAIETPDLAPNLTSSIDESIATLDHEVFRTIREHFQQIRQAINKLQPLTSEPVTEATNSSSSGNNTSSMMDWMRELESLTTNLPVIHQAVHVIGSQIRNLRDRLIRIRPLTESSAISVRDAATSGKTVNLTSKQVDEWVRELDMIDEEFTGIRNSWDKMIAEGIPLIASYNNLDNDLKYQAEVSKQEDIDISTTGERLQAILKLIAAARERLRESVSKSMERVRGGSGSVPGSNGGSIIPGLEVNAKIILPGQNSTESLSIEEHRDHTRQEIANQTVSTMNALTTSVKILRSNISTLSELYTKLLASYILNLTQIRIRNVAAAVAGSRTTVDANGQVVVPSGVPGGTDPQTEKQGMRDTVPGAVKETTTANSKDPYADLNLMRALGREVNQIVSVVSRVTGMG